MAESFTIRQSKTILARSCEEKALTGTAFLRMPGVNRQGQAHIVSTAIVSPGSGKGAGEVEATPWLRTWFSIDPQPARISQRSTSVLFSFVLSLLIVAGPFAIRQSKTSYGFQILVWLRITKEFGDLIQLGVTRTAFCYFRLGGSTTCTGL